MKTSLNIPMARHRVAEISSFLRQYPMLLFLLGGMIFLAIFYTFYASIDGTWYQVRDDGVITMSHAKNWVDYGFIGVNPSGGRVEGYSAPVQFFLYAATYALSGIHYATFAHLQTFVFTFLLGGIFILFFKEKPLGALLLSALAAAFLARNATFLEWHGSGMENPITHVLMLATIWILTTFVRDKKIIYPWAGIVFLSAISRLDSVAYVAPILIFFSGFWLYSFRNWKGLYFSLIVFALWLTFHLWRYWYFGDFLPNTVHAQGVVHRFDQFTGNLGINEILMNTWDKIVTDTFDTWRPKEIFAIIIAFLISIPIVLYYRVEKSILFLLLATVIMILLKELHLSLVNFSRLDPFRTSTHGVTFIALAVATIIYATPYRKPLQSVIPILLFVGMSFYTLTLPKPYYLCCDVQFFENIQDHISKIADKEEIHRPTIGNPDLGAMSWHKNFNVVDFAHLGSPISSSLKRKHPVLFDYVFDYAAPDIIELHSGWLCGALPNFPHWNMNPRLWDIYDLESGDIDRTECSQTMRASSQPRIWIRKDIRKGSGTPERMLMDDLTANLSLDRLRRELTDCQSDPQRHCVYVARSAFRFLPEWKKAGQIDALHEIFSASRTKDYDLYLINGHRDGQAYRRAIAHIESRHATRMIEKSSFP